MEQPNAEIPDKLALKPDDVVEATDATSVAQGVVEDHADILNAQAESGERLSSKTKSLFRIGPGLITGVADDDPSGIGTYSVAGAQFGYQLLWLAPLCMPLMIAVQEMCGRLALVTSKGLSAIIKEHYPKWLLYSVLMLLAGANTINVYADINIMAASMKMLFFGFSFALWATLLTVAIVVAQITIPYKPVSFKNVKNSIADTLHTAADTLGNKMADKDSRCGLAKLGKQASEGLDRSADYIRDFDYKPADARSGSSSGRVRGAAFCLRALLA